MSKRRRISHEFSDHSDIASQSLLAWLFTATRWPCYETLHRVRAPRTSNGTHIWCSALTRQVVSIVLAHRKPSLMAFRYSAIAYHNATVTPFTTIVASTEYINMMRRFEQESNGSRLYRPWQRCGPRHERRSPYDESFLSFLYSIFRWVVAWWPRQPIASAAPVDPETMIFYDNLRALKLATEKFEHTRSLVYMGLVVPEWFTDAQACKLFRAVGKLGSFHTGSGASYRSCIR